MIKDLLLNNGVELELETLYQDKELFKQVIIKTIHPVIGKFEELKDLYVGKLATVSNTNASPETIDTIVDLCGITGTMYSLACGYMETISKYFDVKEELH